VRVFGIQYFKNKAYNS